MTKIPLFSSQRPFLYKLEDKKGITVVFYFHKYRNIKSTFSRGIDGKWVGVFASRTLERPSRIGISNVKIIKIEKTTLYVKNLDAIDGTPVFDIKLGQKVCW
ncbi:MAG: TrmO family methyltransferase [Promethearchaeia archaeon]